MDIQTIIVDVFASLGAFGVLFTSLGVVLPGQAGSFCAKLGVDIKGLLGLEATVENVANLADKK